MISDPRLKLLIDARKIRILTFSLMHFFLHFSSFLSLIKKDNDVVLEKWFVVHSAPQNKYDGLSKFHYPNMSGFLNVKI